MARAEQLPPPRGTFFAWLLLTGRGWGKTAATSRAVNQRVRSGQWRSPAIIGPTAGDLRTFMVEGPTGLLATADPDFRPIYAPSQRKITWPNEVSAVLYTADEPDRIRAGNHDGAWASEVAAWRFPKSMENLELMLRIGDSPELFVDTTPKPREFLRKLRNASDTIVVRGSTKDNAEHLSPKFYSRLHEKYGGTRVGLQELEGVLFEDVAGALWTMEMIEKARVDRDYYNRREIKRIVVGVDPMASEDLARESTDEGPASETGIVTVAIDSAPVPHLYVLSDKSMSALPEQWAAAVAEAVDDHEADCVVAEKNNGGAMVRSVLQASLVKAAVHTVWASKGKRARAEPISSLYEQGRVHHVGSFVELEAEMCSYTGEPGERSPNRLDANVWACWELALAGGSHSLAF